MIVTSQPYNCFVSYICKLYCNTTSSGGNVTHRTLQTDWYSVIGPQPDQLPWRAAAHGYPLRTGPEFGDTAISSGVTAAAANSDLIVQPWRTCSN